MVCRVFVQFVTEPANLLPVLLRVLAIEVDALPRKIRDVSVTNLRRFEGPFESVDVISPFHSLTLDSR